MWCKQVPCSGMKSTICHSPHVRWMSKSRAAERWCRRTAFPQKRKMTCLRSSCSRSPSCSRASQAPCHRTDSGNSSRCSASHCSRMICRSRGWTSRMICCSLLLPVSWKVTCHQSLTKQLTSLLIISRLPRIPSTDIWFGIYITLRTCRQLNGKSSQNENSVTYLISMSSYIFCGANGLLSTPAAKSKKYP